MPTLAKASYHLSKASDMLWTSPVGKGSAAVRGNCMFEGGNLLLNLTPVTNTPKILQPGLQLNFMSCNSTAGSSLPDLSFHF